jgi:heme/copper-type cytochrome/quinol oxidase subunit 1
LVILYVDHRYGHVFLGGNFGIWGRIDWVVKTPTMFIYLVPVLGVAAEVVIATARRRVFEPLAMYFTIGLVGLFGFGAWMNFSITNEGSDLGDGFEGVVLVALYAGAALGATALIALLGFALFQSRKSLKLGALNTPVLSVLGAGKFVVVAAVYGLVGAGVDWLEIAGRGNDGNPYLRDTTWTAGQQSILIYGAALLGLVAALHWWAPKIWGRTLNDSLGKLTFLLIAVGATLASLGPALSGLLYDQPDLVYGDPAQTSLYAETVDGGGAEAMAWLGTAGILVVIAGALLLKLNLVVSLVLRKGKQADSDPWDGAAPEWMLESPPTPGALDALPDLDSGTPLLDMADAAADEQDAVEEVKV